MLSGEGWVLALLGIKIYDGASSVKPVWKRSILLQTHRREEMDPSPWQDWSSFMNVEVCAHPWLGVDELGGIIKIMKFH
jgi:hypothetical protein